MATPFHLSVLTPEKSVFEGAVEYVEVPGAAGYLGVLAHHAPLITMLKDGRLEMRDPSGRVTAWHVTGGFLGKYLAATNLKPAAKMPPPYVAASAEPSAARGAYLANAAD